MLDRRTFLRSSASLTLAPFALSACSSTSSSDGPLFKISLAQWSLNKQLFKRADPHLDNLDFAKAARAFGIEAVEYVNQFFKDKARDASYIAEMKKRADGEGVQSLLIMIDGEGALGHADDGKRREAVERHVPWLEAAKALGCHSIRVNASSSGNYDEQRDRAADGLSRLSERAEPLGLNVIVENHGGLSSNGAWLAAVIGQVGRANCGTLPDFGNFRTGKDEWYDRYQGVAELMPFAKAVSAKSHDFDAEGNEIHTDYVRMMKIVLGAGYDGYVGIEYEGGKLSAHDGIRATKALLERAREALSPA